MTRILYLATALAITLNPVFASEHAQDMTRYVDDLVNELVKLDYASCINSLDEQANLTRTIERQAETSRPALNLTLEAKRLVCEAQRLGREAQRLKIERDRLLTRADELDEKWLEAKSLSPNSVIEFDGRDASQKRMRKDAEIISGTVAQLASVSNQLTNEARRVLSLAFEEVAQLEEFERNTLLASLDAETQKEIFDRLFGLQSPRKAV